MIRPVREADIPACVSLARLLHQSGNYAGTQWSDRKVAGLFIMSLTRPRDVWAQVLERDGEIVGGMLAMIKAPWYGDGRHAHDYGLFCRPGHRLGLAGPLKLIRAYVEWAEFHDAERIYIGNATGYLPDRVRRLYERAGFKLVGFNMLYMGGGTNG